MSLSRSPIWTHRDGSPSRRVDCSRFSSQRTLSLASMGTRVGLTLRFKALVPLNLLRVQNLITASPIGGHSEVTARLECLRTPHSVWSRGLPSFPFLPQHL